jgi:hypothetical protein
MFAIFDMSPNPGIFDMSPKPGILDMSPKPGIEGAPPPRARDSLADALDADRSSVAMRGVQRFRAGRLRAAPVSAEEPAAFLAMMRSWMGYGALDAHRHETPRRAFRQAGPPATAACRG